MTSYTKGKSKGPIMLIQTKLTGQAGEYKRTVPFLPIGEQAQTNIIFSQKAYSALQVKLVR